MSTLDNVLRAIDAQPHTKRKPYRDGYAMNSPFDPASDSMSFYIFDIRADGEGATYKYFAKDESGTLYDLAQRLGVEIVGDDTRREVASTKRAFDGLADYAKSHGITPEYLRQCKWEQVSYQNRPALRFATSGGYRYRFLDDGKNKYTSETGYAICWYGLDRAISSARDAGVDSIVLCNGEISTISATYHGIPAFCKTSGESAIPAELLDELNNKWTGKIIIALDCDEAGRRASATIREQLNGNGLEVDLMLSDGGDLADFCTLYTSQALEQLTQLVSKQNVTPEPIKHETDALRSDKLIGSVVDELRGNQHIAQAAFPFPLIALRKFGGFAEMCETGKITLIAGGSGTGKTQFLETINDKLNRDGISGLWFGAEWRPDEMLWRRIQRWSTHLQNGVPVTYDDIRKHRLYLKNEQDGIHPDDNLGVKLSDSKWESLNHTIPFIESFAGTTEYFDDAPTLQNLFDMMMVSMEREKRNGKTILYAIFDYVQLLKASSPDSSVNRYEYAFEMVKQFAIEANVHVFMTSQVNKQNQADIANGSSLGMESAHYVRGDKANLFLTLNRQYYKRGDEYVETPAFYLNIVKMSLGGRPDGYTEPSLRVPMVMNPLELKFSTYRDWREFNVEPFTLLPDNHYYTGGDHPASFRF